MASTDSSDNAVVITQQVRINTAYESFKHNASLAMLVLAPVLVAIPPRKLDLYTFSLAGAFVASANQLNVERTGRGLLSQFGYNRGDTTAGSAADSQRWRSISTESKTTTLNPPLDGRHAHELGRTDAEGSIEQTRDKFWTGTETEGWKEKRLREEQEKLDRGEGYGSMIMDQIWDVWNWGEDKGKELKKLDQNTIEQSKSETSNR